MLLKSNLSTGEGWQGTGRYPWEPQMRSESKARSVLISGEKESVGV